MSTGSGSRTSRLALRLADALVYAVLFTGVFVVGFGTLSLAVSGDLVGLKWVLFAVGFFTLALGSLKLRPGPAWKEDSDGLVANSRSSRGFQAYVDRVSPLAGRPGARASDGLRLFVAALVMLATSFLLETVFGVVPG